MSHYIWIFISIPLYAAGLFFLFRELFAPAKDGRRKGYIVAAVFFTFASYALLLYAIYLMDAKIEASAKLRKAVEAGKLDYVESKLEVVARTGRRRKRADEIFGASGESGALREARSEGVLWIDRETSRCVATLGTRDGLQEGSLIDVYDGAKKIGKATVTEAHDIISYAEPVGKTPDEFPENYYKIRIP